jgi:ribosomal protein L12E/L44/L45/RPP1/RPP2
VYSRFFDTHVVDRRANGVDGLLAAMEDKRIEVSLHAAAKAQAAKTFKLPTPALAGAGGNPDRPTARPDQNLKDKDLKDNEKREKREEDKTRQHKKPEPEAEG